MGHAHPFLSFLLHVHDDLLQSFYQSWAAHLCDSVGSSSFEFVNLMVKQNRISAAVSTPITLAETSSFSFDSSPLFSVGGCIPHTMEPHRRLG